MTFTQFVGGGSGAVGTTGGGGAGVSMGAGGGASATGGGAAVGDEGVLGEPPHEASAMAHPKNRASPSVRGVGGLMYEVPVPRWPGLNPHAGYLVYIVYCGQPRRNISDSFGAAVYMRGAGLRTGRK